MHSLFNQLCDVSESMAFNSCQLNSSSQFNTSNCKPIGYNGLKCFNCFGICEGEQFCNHCGGTGFITDNHPLAMLMNEVFERKLGRTEVAKQSAWAEYDDVQTIRQQEEQLDEKKIICDICNKQCDINFKYFCQCCECFFVCVKCADQKSDEIDHQHPLATNRNLPKPLFLLKRTSSSHLNSNKKSDPDSQEHRSEKRNKTDHTQKSNLQFFNVCDIMEQVSQTFGKVAQNIFKAQSESISDDDQSEFGMLQTNNVIYRLRLNEVQGSDKGVKNINEGLSCQKILAKSVNSPSLRPTDDMCIETHQSIEFNLSQIKSIRPSIGNRESFGFAHENFVQQVCSNCSVQLKDVYSVCKTCEDMNQTFMVCSQCEDKSLYVHDKQHRMEMMLGNLLGRRSEMISKNLIQSDGEELHCSELEVKQQNHLEVKQDQYHQVMLPTAIRKKSTLEERPPRLQQSPFGQNSSQKKSFSKMKSTDSFQFANKPKKINVKTFGEQSLVNIDCQGLFNSTELTEDFETICLVRKRSSLNEVNNSQSHLPHPSKFNNGKQKPKVGFAQIGSDDDDIVHIDCVSSESQQEEIIFQQKFHNQKSFVKGSRTNKRFSSAKSLIFSKKQNKQLTSSYQEKQQITCSRTALKYTQQLFTRQHQSEIITQSTNQKEKIEFIFHQYNCDECGVGPIKNVRYHCLQCEDFDVCENCYGAELVANHKHCFEKIDGAKKLLEKKSMIVQRKDLNKGRQSMLNSTNVGMLATSKKTVEMIKRSVCQLNNSVSSLSKSYGSQLSFESQRMSYKGKLQYC